MTDPRRATTDRIPPSRPMPPSDPPGADDWEAVVKFVEEVGEYQAERRHALRNDLHVQLGELELKFDEILAEQKSITTQLKELNLVLQGAMGQPGHLHMAHDTRTRVHALEKRMNMMFGGLAVLTFVVPLAIKFFSS